MLFDTGIIMFDVGVDCPCSCSMLLDNVVDMYGFSTNCSRCCLKLFDTGMKMFDVGDDCPCCAIFFDAGVTMFSDGIERPCCRLMLIDASVDCSFCRC